MLHNKMVCIHDIRYVILSTLFPLFMSNQACSNKNSHPSPPPIDRFGCGGRRDACTSKSVLAVQPTHSGSWLRAVPGCWCRFLRSLTARRSTGQSRPPPQTQTAGWVRVHSIYETDLGPLQNRVPCVSEAGSAAALRNRAAAAAFSTG